MNLKAKFLQFTLYEHSSSAGKPPKAIVASLSADPFSFLSTEEQSQRSATMTLETKEVAEPPVVWFTVEFPQVMESDVVRCMQTGVLAKRKNVLEERVERLKTEFKQVHQKLVQQTEAFSSIQFDAGSISIFIEPEKSCFLTCGSGQRKKDKRCLLM